MSRIELFGAAVCIALLPLVSFASTGTRGGGHPTAVEFLLRSKSIGRWILTSNIGLTDRECQRVHDLARELAADMDDETKTPIRPTRESLRDASGAPKPLMFSKVPRRIEINIDEWEGMSENQKLVSAALELFGLAGIAGRYDVAGLVALNFSDIRRAQSTIEASWSYERAVRVSGVTTYFSPGIYIAGKKPILMGILTGTYQDRNLEQIVSFMCQELGHSKATSMNTIAPTENWLAAIFDAGQGYRGLMMALKDRDQLMFSVSCR